MVYAMEPESRLLVYAKILFVAEFCLAPGKEMNTICLEHVSNMVPILKPHKKAWFELNEFSFRCVQVPS
ncbi:unnamed protein product [Meloidogyne enterolobii]|uniref:Uncharacterized protein n=1 Tax=Meloidogyne enterolobii TaxID=390850 RepID=A0ACB0YY26_MELEN